MEDGLEGARVVCRLEEVAEDVAVEALHVEAVLEVVRAISRVEDVVGDLDVEALPEVVVAEVVIVLLEVDLLPEEFEIEVVGVKAGVYVTCLGMFVSGAEFMQIKVEFVVVVLLPADTVSVAQPRVLPCSRSSLELFDNIPRPFPSLEPSLSLLYLPIVASCDPFPSPCRPAPAFPLRVLQPLLCPCPHPSPTLFLPLTFSPRLPRARLHISHVCTLCQGEDTRVQGHTCARTHVCIPGALHRDEAGQEH